LPLAKSNYEVSFSKQLPDYLKQKNSDTKRSNDDKDLKIISYLRKLGYIGPILPVSRKHPNKIEAILTHTLDPCLDQIAYRFPELREPIVVKNWGKPPTEYFKCSLSRNDFLKLLERNNIMVFTSIDAFNKKKEELESQLRTMNFIDELEERYKSLHKPLTAA
jgi:hypothetical protein